MHILENTTEEQNRQSKEPILKDLDGQNGDPYSKEKVTMREDLTLEDKDRQDEEHSLNEQFSIHGDREDKQSGKNVHQHEERPFSCKICYSSFTKYRFLKQHCAVHMEKPFACSMCGKRYRVSRKYREHESIPHKQKCKICLKMFIKYSDLKMHRQTSHPDRVRHRGRILEKHPTETQNTGSEEQVTKMPVSEKEICDAILSVYKKKKEKPTFRCDLCSKEFKQKGILSAHKQIKHPNECNECPAKFIHLSALIDHKQTKHSNDHSFECDVCPAKFKVKSQLISHRQSHLRSYSCDICSEKFNTHHDLRRHSYQMHPEYKPHTCKVCSKSFKRYVSLVAHEHMQHANSHECSICGKQYSMLKILRKHESKEHRESCSICSVKFVDIHDLRRHKEKVHKTFIVQRYYTAGQAKFATKLESYLKMQSKDQTDVHEHSHLNTDTLQQTSHAAGGDFSKIDKKECEFELAKDYSTMSNELHATSVVSSGRTSGRCELDSCKEEMVSCKDKCEEDCKEKDECFEKRQRNIGQTLQVQMCEAAKSDTAALTKDIFFQDPYITEVEVYFCKTNEKDVTENEEQQPENT